MDQERREPAAAGGAGPEVPPDVVGLELEAALRRLGGRYRCTLRFTAPPRPKGEKGAVRVVAQRRVMRPGTEALHAIELVCAREYYEQRPGLDGEA
ncbi:MAG: hypothetical protein IMX02_04090 [Limnochordaceae bacterium]|nr:hypothetical protein [Limnochordaceae bacterium]